MTLFTAPAENARVLLAGVQRQLIGAHVLLLTRLLRKSARHEYEGFEPESQLDRRIILTLLRVEAGRVSELAYHLGHDVAQVSRALTAMRRDGLVARGPQRDPYRLTEQGLALSRVLDEVALRREARLTAGLDPQQMFELAGLLGNLLHRAGLAMLEELSRARVVPHDITREITLDGEPGSAAASMPPFEIHSRAHPLLINLAAVISRTATATFKRLTDVSSFEWRLLVNIAERPGLRFTDIALHVDSDKAQVSRTLESLVHAGIVERSREGPGGPILLALTEQGHRLHGIMREDALARNKTLLADMSAAQRQRIQFYFELLISNAGAMCEGLDGGELGA